MALYGIYGSHTTESCPLNNREVAERVVAVAESDVQSTASKYKISEIVGQYHSALEHTFLWIVDAEDVEAQLRSVFRQALSSRGLNMIIVRKPCQAAD